MTVVAGIIASVVFIVILVYAVIRARRANPEQSSTEMHPDNFKKPPIERVDKILEDKKG